MVVEILITWYIALYDSILNDKIENYTNAIYGNIIGNISIKKHVIFLHG